MIYFIFYGFFMSESINREGLAQTEHTPESALTQEMQDFIVSKLGLKLEDLSSAQANPSFSGDLQNLMNNSENSTERTAFLGKYIYEPIIAEAKQVGKDPVDFAEEMRTTGKMNFSQARGFKKYYADQAAINRNEKITKEEHKVWEIKDTVSDKDNRIQDLQQIHLDREKAVTEHNARAFWSLNTQWQEQITQWIKDEKFLKELQDKWVLNASEIQSGNFNQTITGYYIARHQAELAHLATNEEQFRNSSKNIADALGLDRHFPLAEIERTIPPGDRRNTVLANSADLLNSGKYDPELTTYNAGTGYITFHNDVTGDTSRIDTSREPIKIEYMKDGLSISRELDSVNGEEAEKEKSRDKAVWQVREWGQKLEKGISDFRTLRTAEYDLAGTPDKNGKTPNLFGTYVQENYENHEKYTWLEQSYMNDIGTIAPRDKAKITTLENMISLCDNMKQNNAKNILDGNLDSWDREKISNMLEARSYQLHELKNQEESLQKIDTKALSYIPTRMSSADWENKAKESITYFSSLGLDKLGQQGFTEFLDAWNYQNKSQKEFQIDLSKNPELDPFQQKALRSAIDMKILKNGQNYNETFQNLEKKLNSNTWIQRNWNTPEKRANFLFSGKINGSNRSKEDKNQQKQIDSIDNGSDQNTESQYA